MSDETHIGKLKAEKAFEDIQRTTELNRKLKEIGVSVDDPFREFSHPCRGSCSGYTQGYEKGIGEGYNSAIELLNSHEAHEFQREHGSFLNCARWVCWLREKIK